MIRFWIRKSGFGFPAPPPQKNAPLHRCNLQVCLLFSDSKTMATVVKGCVFLGKSKSGFPIPKTNHESLKSTLWVESSDQIQIRIFEIHNLSIFLVKDSKKVFLTSGFPNTNVWHVDGALLWAIVYISFRVFHLFTFVDCFLTLTCHVFCTYVVSACAGLFSKF